MREQPLGYVLIVEDDASVRDMLSWLLRAEGYHVQAALDGASALDLLRAGAVPTQIILLDLNMPTMTGWEFRQAQKRDRALAHIPIAVISADRSLAEQPFAIDAVGYFLKPLDFPRLLDLIAQTCGAQPGEAYPLAATSEER